MRKLNKKILCYDSLKSSGNSPCFGYQPWKLCLLTALEDSSTLSEGKDITSFTNEADPQLTDMYWTMNVLIYT